MLKFEDVVETALERKKVGNMSPFFDKKSPAIRTKSFKSEMGQSSKKEDINTFNDACNSHMYKAASGKVSGYQGSQNKADCEDKNKRECSIIFDKSEDEESKSYSFSSDGD